jgi:O-antigen/teichoic acid export membrane protein
LLFSLLAACIVAVLGTALMALEHPEKNFWSYVASSVTAIAVGAPLAALRGVQGAAGGIVLAGLTSASFMYYFYRQVAVTETPFLAPSHGCLRDDEDKRAAVATD